MGHLWTPWLTARGFAADRASCSSRTGKPGWRWQNLALKVELPPQEHRPPGNRLGGRGPGPQWTQPRVGAVLLETSGLDPATGPVEGKYSAATYQPRGPHRQTWCRRGEGSQPPACRDAGTSRCHPPGGAQGCWPGGSVQSPGSVPPRQPATPPCWAGQIRTCSRARGPRDWWVNLSTAFPCLGLSQQPLTSA